MTYIRQHKRPQEQRNRFIVGAVVVLALVLGSIQFMAPQTFPAIFAAVAKPFWQMRFSAESGAFRSASSILAENESLKMQLSELKLSLASSSLEMLQSDNRDLLAMYGRASTTPRQQYILGAVLARPPFMPYDELIIDIGQSDGISTTSQVYSPERVLIGRIAQLLAHSAKVALYSSPKESYSVLIGPSHVPANATGQGGGQYRASVPHGSSVQVGDFVSDSTLYDNAFGVVVSIITDPSDPFDTVMFAPTINIYQTRFVLVDSGKAFPVRK